MLKQQKGGMVNMAQQQYGDSMAQDASNVANAAVQTAKDVKTVAAVAGNVATGNVAGAVKEVIKNPEFLKKLLCVALVIGFFQFMLIAGPFIVAIAMPGSIFSAVKDAFNHKEENVLEGWDMSDADDSLKTTANGFYDYLSSEGTESEQSFFTSNTADYGDSPSTDAFWGESNLQITALDKYFRKSYKNAATRANNKYDDLVDEDALTQQALDDGIESSDYVKFVTNNMTTDDNKGFQRVSFYIMALDSYKYTTSNDETQEDADTERLKRMIKKAKEISPNGLLDDAITALSALGINIDLGSDKLWVVSTDTTYDDVQDVVGYETIKEWVVDEYDKNGKPVKGHEEDTGEIDPQRPIMKMVRTYTTTISLELNSNIRNSLYESYGIDPTENIGNHSDAFKSTESPNYSTTENLNGKTMTAADIIEQQVEQYMEVYNVPRTAGGTGTEIGTIGPGGSGQVSNMSDEEIQAILAATNNGNYTPKQQALVSKLQDALNSPLGLTGYMKSIGCTVATNYCQAFVADFYSKCGQARISFGSAINAYNTSAICKKGQQGYDTPPDGASVYIGANHVGIYIGGCVIDSVYGQIQVMPFEKWKSQKYYQSGGGYLGWGFNGWDVS
jgi:hypothetical protein